MKQHALDEETVIESTIRLSADKLIEEELKGSIKHPSMVK